MRKEKAVAKKKEKELGLCSTQNYPQKKITKIKYAIFCLRRIVSKSNIKDDQGDRVSDDEHPERCGRGMGQGSGQGIEVGRGQVRRHGSDAGVPQILRPLNCLEMDTEQTFTMLNKKD
eukprot:SAG22_NODE_8533_length_647_cov_2.470803_1_plen_118_part_00